MVGVTTEQLDAIYAMYGLTDFPKSDNFKVGYDLHLVNRTELAADAWERGAKNDSCVACMFFYAEWQFSRNNYHLALPWALEGAIRGNTHSMQKLVVKCYDNKTKPGVVFAAHALENHWVKTMNELESIPLINKARKVVKKANANRCLVCGRVDSEDRTFQKCGICSYYSYCGKACQVKHWKKGNHISECRQVMILRQYGKPRYIIEIRDAIIRGDDPKHIRRLQTLRTKLGLNRPTEEYEELVVLLNSNACNNKSGGEFVSLPWSSSTWISSFIIFLISLFALNMTVMTSLFLSLLVYIGSIFIILIVSYYNFPSRYEYLTARKDGTVHIGSTPEAI